MAESDIEIRRLSPGAIFELCRILECGEGWKHLMGTIVDGDTNKQKYTVEHIKLVECAGGKQNRTCSEILLEEWGTSGKKRPRLSTLRDLLIKIELFRAAEYISVKLLKEGVPERPLIGPAAYIEIPSTLAITLPSAPAYDFSESVKSINFQDTVPVVSEFEQVLAGVIEYNFDDLETGTKNFSSSLRLGGGAFGEVYLCRFKDGKEVAVKRLFDAAPGGDPAFQFRNELQTLSDLSHPNLLPLLGFSSKGPSLCLIYTYMLNGSLQDCLVPKRTKCLDWSDRLKIAQGSAEGILYLHTCREKPLVHRDVKSANILLDENFIPKVGDFGLIRSGASTNTNSVAITTTVVGTSAYMAPEAFRGDVSVKMDVFSFGVVLLELVTGLLPYDENRDGCDLASHVDEVDDIDKLMDKKANGDTNIAMELYSLAQECLLEKKHRPPISNVCLILNEIIKKNLN